MRVSKWIGLAAVAGVAAGGVVIARAERQRRAYTSDDIRRHLHDRLAAAGPSVSGESGAGGQG